MAPPWTAEVYVTEELARGLIEEQFPELAPFRLRLFGEGWDNTAFLVDEKLLFRFPRRRLAAPLVLSECRLLPLIASQVPLAVPEPLFVGKATEEYPWQFSGYPLLPGIAVSEAKLTDEERASIAAPLGRFLRALHQIPPQEALQRGAGGDTIGRMDLSKRIPISGTMLDENRHILNNNVRGLQAILDACPMDYMPQTDTVVHGDLYSRHLLVNDRRALCGVIDWGDCHVGDRAVDLAPAFTLFPIPSRIRFFAAYGPVTERAIHVAKVRALYHSLNVLRYARDIRDEPLEREALTGLQNLVS